MAAAIKSLSFCFSPIFQFHSPEFLDDNEHRCHMTMLCSVNLKGYRVHLEQRFIVVAAVKK